MTLREARLASVTFREAIVRPRAVSVALPRSAYRFGFDTAMLATPPGERDAPLVLIFTAAASAVAGRASAARSGTTRSRRMGRLSWRALRDATR